MAVLKERTISTALFVQLPEQEQIDRGFKECCYEQCVLAHPSSTKDEQNDFKGVFFQRQSPTDLCDFVLIRLSDLVEFDLDDGTFGVFTDFDGFVDNPDMKTFILDWKKVLLAFGEGGYQIRKDITIASIVIPILSNTYTLKQYSVATAEHTVRLDLEMNGQLKREGLDFEGTDFRSTIRVRGFFGNNNPEFIQRNQIVRDKNTNVQNYMSKENKYVLQTEYLPSCITEEILGFFLFANKKWISDFNSNNHSYELTKVPVHFETNDGTEYRAQIRNAQLNMTFTDRFLDNEKFNC